MASKRAKFPAKMQAKAPAKPPAPKANVSAVNLPKLSNEFKAELATYMESLKKGADHELPASGSIKVARMCSMLPEAIAFFIEHAQPVGVSVGFADHPEIFHSRLSLGYDVACVSGQPNPCEKYFFFIESLAKLAESKKITEPAILLERYTKFFQNTLVDMVAKINASGSFSQMKNASFEQRGGYSPAYPNVQTGFDRGIAFIPKEMRDSMHKDSDAEEMTDAQLLSKLGELGVKVQPDTARDALIASYKNEDAKNKKKQAGTHYNFTDEMDSGKTYIVATIYNLVFSALNHYDPYILQNSGSWKAFVKKCSVFHENGWNDKFIMNCPSVQTDVFKMLKNSNLHTIHAQLTQSLTQRLRALYPGLEVVHQSTTQLIFNPIDDFKLLSDIDSKVFDVALLNLNTIKMVTKQNTPGRDPMFSVCQNYNWGSKNFDPIPTFKIIGLNGNLAAPVHRQVFFGQEPEQQDLVFMHGDFLAQYISGTVTVINKDDLSAIVAKR